MIKDLCFEIIEACPNNCKFCSSNSCLDKKNIISFEDFKRVLDYFMSEGGIEELSLSGGEPFLHPDLFRMVEYAKNLGIRTVIFTSGVKMSVSLSKDVIEFYSRELNDKIQEVMEREPWNERLISNLKKFYSKMLDCSCFSPISKEEFFQLEKLGLNKIVFDYQAYEYDIDKYLMGRDSEKYHCLMTSLINVDVASLIETNVHFIPMKPNYREIPDILEMLEIANIDNISILNFVPQGRGLINVKELMISEKELEEFMELLDRSKNLFSGNIRIGIPLMKDNIHKCNAGLEKLDVKFDGTVLPCPAFKELTMETMRKYGIKYYNIYENLNEIKMVGGKRLVPLCKRVYKQNL